MHELKDEQNKRANYIALSEPDVEIEFKMPNDGIEMQYDDWRIPYIGRFVTDEYKKKFCYEDEYLKSCRYIGIYKFQWDGHPDHVDDGCFDDSNYRHYLCVELFDAGPMRGRVKMIEARHRNFWHTTSNWQDHSESEIFEVCGPNEEEIAEYCKLLDLCTRSCAQDEAEALLREVVANSDEYEFLDNNLQCLHSKLTISVVEMTRIITLARSFLEVFFFGTVMEELLEKQGKDWRSDAVESFLSRLDILDFYKGMDLEKLKQEFLMRMCKQGRIVQKFLGVGEHVYVAMLKGTMEERMASPARTIKWGRQGERFLWKGEYGYRNSPLGIPNGSLCFFDRKRFCVGYVTKENTAFKLTRPKDNVSIGRLAPDGMVYNSKGECLGKGWEICANGLSISILEMSLVHRSDFIEVRKWHEHSNYVGYVMECKYAIEGDVNTAKCEKYVWEGTGWDMRWIGLAFFGYVDEELFKKAARES